MLSKTNAVVLCFGALIGGSVLADHDPAKLSKMLKTDGPLPQNRPKIAHVNMGGTIAWKAPSPLLYFNYTGHERYTPAEIVNLVPEVRRIADIQIVEAPPEGIDQVDMPKAAKIIMAELARPDVVGAVVPTGTWALEEVAYFLHLTVKSDKPVVVTGSQRPPNTYSSDAHANYYNAVRLAIDPQAKGKGVLVLLNDEINSARDVTKSAISRLQTFRSREFGPLGSTDADQVVFYRAPMRKHTYMNEFDIARYTSIKDLPRVDIVHGCRGCDDALIKAAVAAGAKGIVVATMGDGWLPEIETALKDAAKSGVVVVRSSRVGENRVTPWHRYDGVFVSGDNLLPQKARLLLALALTKTNDVNQVQKFFDEY